MEEFLVELKKSYGEKVELTEEQKEAIQTVLNGKRVVIVQNTGWGNSLLYFLTTKVLRKKGEGIVLIVSPFLELMDNLNDSIDKFELCVATVTPKNTGDWDSIVEESNQNKIDALIVSPELLPNIELKKRLIAKLTVKISLLIMDEAHSISDRSHDFRSDYIKIKDFLNTFPTKIPVLASSISADNRVLREISKQLGSKPPIYKEFFSRELLSLQVIELLTKEERMAWILHNIESLPGAGIIYCSTVNECRLLSKWLSQNDIPSDNYVAELSIEKKNEVYHAFLNNTIKALVTTAAFGMGLDKPDIGFMIHFQRPLNIMEYYHQIGRLGRGKSPAYAVLLCGGEDNDCYKYILESGFPIETQMADIVNTIDKNPGITIPQLEQYLNIKSIIINEYIKYLLVTGAVNVEDNKYSMSPRAWTPDTRKSRKISDARREEFEQMFDFVNLEDCYMNYITKIVNVIEDEGDENYEICGNCGLCLENPLFSSELPEELVLNAQQFICEDFGMIEVRKKWPAGEIIDGSNDIPNDFICETGRILCNYGDAGWGRLVAVGKYKYEFFDNQLVSASDLLLKDFIKNNNIKWVASVPSFRRPELVTSFAKRLALKLGLRYINILKKISENRRQRELNTDYLKCKNAYTSFETEDMDIEQDIHHENVLLVDDMVDSGWTFTVCGYMLRISGSGKVFPYALVYSPGRNNDK